MLGLGCGRGDVRLAGVAVAYGVDARLAGDERSARPRSPSPGFRAERTRHNSAAQARPRMYAGGRLH